MIQLKELTLGYGQRILLDKVSARITGGQLVALLGRNGTGKSTLLRAIMGLEKPQTGEIVLQGKNIASLKPEKLARNISFVTTDKVRIANLRCEDVVALGRAPYTNWIGQLQPADQERVDKAMQLVGMSGYADKTMDKMSDGECQRIMIARALAQDTPVVLLDEPTAFLDLPNRYELCLLLKKLARCDYEALKYFTEFWCSDNTDPIERLFIQWGFSQIFPAKAMDAHVTSWNKKTSVKFRTDVASMCKLGFDLGLKELNADEQTFCQNAVANWTRLKKVILDGDQYRLVSPYDGNHMSVMYAAPDKNKAVLYTYDIHPRFGEKLLPVKLQGLDAKKMYKVKEINLMPNSKSNLAANENTYSGDYLMKVGINAFTTNQAFSRVIELTAE